MPNPTLLTESSALELAKKLTDYSEYASPIARALLHAQLQGQITAMDECCAHRCFGCNKGYKTIERDGRVLHVVLEREVVCESQAGQSRLRELRAELDKLEAKCLR